MFATLSGYEKKKERERHIERKTFKKKEKRKK